MLHVVCGVPQGSTLGPLLFIIYVNSLLQLKLHGPVFSFADDTAIVYSGRTHDETKQKCEEDLRTLRNWFLFHKICPNLQKTKILEYNYKKTKIESPIITWHLRNCNGNPCTNNCTPVEKVHEIKYLGVYLNSNLNWSSHSHYLQTKLRKLNYLIYYLKKTVPIKIRRRIYLALYEPVLTYGMECWGKAADYITQPIKVLQKGAIRSVAGAGYREHTAPIFNNLKILSYSSLYNRALASLAHRKIVALTKESQTTLSLRSTVYKTPKWKNVKARNQASYQTPIFCSTLPTEIQTYFGHPSFTKRLKKHLLEIQYSSNSN